MLDKGNTQRVLWLGWAKSAKMIICYYKNRLQEGRKEPVVIVDKDMVELNGDSVNRKPVKHLKNQDDD